ncbi:MAG: extracellular solute-binding protein [Methanomassiliicoccales archaeon]|nr:MAG: extracellular solute-binding protein [Methanomassiliicoccales archaeon]
MCFRNFNKVKASLSGCLFTLFLCLPFFAVALSEALAVESEGERTGKLIEGAKKEGKLIWYTTVTLKESEEMLRKFQEKYSFIKPELYRSGDLRLLTKILAEVSAERYIFDVLSITGISAEILKDKGLFMKYLSPHRKFYSESINDPEGYWTDFYLNLNVMGYNTRMVAPNEVPKTYEDLLNPKWKKKLGMDTKAFYWFANMFKSMGEEKALDYMKKLSQQDILFRTGRTLNAQMLAAGEVSICITLYNNRVEEMKAKGAPIEWFAIEPVVPEIHPIGVSSHAPHPHTAKLFVDFVLSKEGQNMIADFYRIPSRIDVSPRIPRLKEGLKILPFDFSIRQDYERYVALYQKILMKR